MSRPVIASRFQSQPAAGGEFTFSLTSGTTQSAAPYMIGLACAEGTIPDYPNLDSGTWQVTVTRRWNDTSVKHAIACGRVDLTSNTPKTIVVSNGNASGGTALTSADIVTAAPSASVQCGSLGTVNLSALLASPFRTWISGAEMVECHYRSQVGTDTSLVVWFRVRLWAGGRMFVRAIVENGYINATTADKSFIPTVTIDGNTVFTYAQKTISAATQSLLGGTTDRYYETVTTSAPHGLVAGQSVSIAGVTGMTSLNGYKGVATIVNSTQFTTEDHQLTYPAYTGGGTVDFAQRRFQRWMSEAWIGGDPQVYPSHGYYPMTAKLVPNFWKRTPTATALNNLFQTYTPLAKGQFTSKMAAVGGASQIGLFAKWDAMYATSGDSRAYKSMMAHTWALNTYPVCFRDANTNLPAKPSDHPNYYHPPGNPAEDISAGALTWEINHHPSVGYMSYLLTGDYDAYETMLFQCVLCYILQNQGVGLNRVMKRQTRGMGWSLRTVSQLAAIYPEGDTVGADYQTLLANNMTFWNGVTDGLGSPSLGYCYEYDLSVGITAPWQHHYNIQSIAHGSDIQPLADMTTYNAVRDFKYKAIVGILGDSSGYCFTRASGNGSMNQGVKVSNVFNTNIANWYTDWKTVETNTWGAVSCSNTLLGTSAGVPGDASIGYWGYLLPAIAHAVDHGASGAQSSWDRITTATNFSTLEASANTGSFHDVPNFGIVPRNYTQVPGTIAALASSTLISGSSFLGDIANINSYVMANDPDWDGTGSNPSFCVGAWNGAFIAPYQGKQWLMMWRNGGHADWFWPFIVGLPLDGSDGWQELKTGDIPYVRQSPPASPLLNSDYYSSISRCASCHTYNGTVYHSPSGLAVAFSGANWGSGNSSSRPMGLNMSSLAETVLSSHGGSAGNIALDHSSDGLIWYYNGTSLFSYNPATGIRATLATPNTPISSPQWASGFISSDVLHLAYIDQSGAGAVRLFKVTPGSSTLAETTLTGVTIPRNAITQGCVGLVWEPTLGQAVIWTGGQILYFMTPSGVVTSQTLTGADPGAAYNTGVCNRFARESARSYVLLSQATVAVHRFVI